MSLSAALLLLLSASCWLAERRAEQTEQLRVSHIQKCAQAEERHALIHKYHHFRYYFYLFMWKLLDNHKHALSKPNHFHFYQPLNADFWIALSGKADLTNHPRCQASACPTSTPPTV
ncbi:hypothetical protein LDENG_00269610 [Lucifuga dentata]|nr:hypothetical protein LDENG_00269610 [Lucifuga dentata]